MRHHNEVLMQKQKQMAAPAAAVPSVDTAAESTATTVAASALAGTNVAAALDAAATTTPNQSADMSKEQNPRQTTMVNVGWDEQHIDVMAENRRSNIIIKGIQERSRLDDQMEVEEMLDYML